MYLDHSATTPVDPRVMEAMLPYFSTEFGNPSSTHYYGQKAETAVLQAREEIANVLGCSLAELVFTSGGSESDNLVLRGITDQKLAERRPVHILTTPVEHMAVTATAAQLAKLPGVDVELLPVSSDGQIDPVEVERRLKGNTCLVSVIYANNEIGTVNPVAEIGRVCRERGIPFHTDALQAALSLELNVDLLSLDLASLGAHKFYGPKGVGVLFIREGISVQPIQTGGEQESGMRGGTLNVPSIVGMAVALKIARQELSEFTAWIEPLRDRLVARILASVPESQMTGHPVDRLPYHASFVFKDIDGNLLLNLLDSAGFACSSGSACKTGSPAPSDVLLATGLSPDWALGSLRVTLGRWTTEEDVEAFCDTLPEIVERGRRLSAL